MSHVRMSHIARINGFPFSGGVSLDLIGLFLLAKNV